MPNVVESETSRLLEQEFTSILDAWIGYQANAGVRRGDLFSDREGREHSALILRTIAKALKQGVTTDGYNFSGADWDDLRAPLEQLTNDRTERGVTPTQVAAFILQLKPAIVTRLSEILPDRQDQLVTEMIHLALVVNEFALYTTEVFINWRETVIARQREELVELSTPVIPLWDGILALPVIGTLDSTRAQDVMETLLNAVVANEATVVVIDITGVQTVDTEVARHLLRTATAVRLMGSECIFSGISPRIAQTMVQLGVELDEFVTRATIEGAMRYAFDQLNLRVSPANEA